MKRREFLATSAVAGATAALGLPAHAQAKPKVAFLLVGPKNDGGWSQHHYESAMKAQEHFGDAVEIIVQESVPEGPDAERVMTQLALDGANLIFTTSFGYMDATISVAAPRDFCRSTPGSRWRAPAAPVRHQTARHRYRRARRAGVCDCRHSRD